MKTVILILSSLVVMASAKAQENNPLGKLLITLCMPNTATYKHLSIPVEQGKKSFSTKQNLTVDASDIELDISMDADEIVMDGDKPVRLRMKTTVFATNADVMGAHMSADFDLNSSVFLNTDDTVADCKEAATRMGKPLVVLGYELIK